MKNIQLGKILKTWQTQKGNQACIRYVKADDLNDMLSYVNDLIAEDTYVMVSGKPMSYKKEAKYLKEAIKQVKLGNKIHLVVEVNGNFAGSCEIRIWDKRKSHVGEIGISLSRNYREEGIGSVCMKVLEDEASKYHLQLLYLHCFETNNRAIHVYQKMGYHTAGAVPSMYFYKNKYIGEVTLYKKLKI